MFKLLVNNKISYVKHPVKKDGVMQDVSWEKAKLKIKNNPNNSEIAMVDKEGNLIEVKVDKVQDIKKEAKKFKNESKVSLELEHSNEQGTTVVTYLYAPKATLSAIYNFINKGFEKKVDSTIDLNETEKEIIMALYSGVSPFDIPEFIGAEVEEVEEVYKKLIEVDALKEIRKRREVELTTRGRNLASKTMGK
ncbi:MAG: Chemotaxis system protein containing CheF-like and HTH domain, archaellum-associated [Candidatus Methanohalarchaeum thermophilum]|uniref:Chemotaxis system protein containing CheF-like and HTH domain, archaellum-associated n=1 Tax=Methanohalarchaeum thermophilum TaxID=1903181 RepID=A0A1Q6DTQ7_METT1|nr:MAG: Chemotaxis system protein containing CheF-like and HTH domain, archaellum-associated [Candidatus Methanohalarchaeum thermophilum]